MKNGKELLMCIIGYPLCILSLAAVPYGVYALLVYKYKWDGGLRFAAIVIAIVCAAIAFLVFLAAQAQSETEQQNRELQRERDRFEQLYREYESKCRRLERDCPESSSPEYEKRCRGSEGESMPQENGLNEESSR